jgi:hypothetical protein
MAQYRWDGQDHNLEEARLFLEQRGWYFSWYPFGIAKGYMLHGGHYDICVPSIQEAIDYEVGNNA